MKSAHWPSAGLSGGFKGPVIFCDLEAERLIIIDVVWMSADEHAL